MNLFSFRRTMLASLFAFAFLLIVASVARADEMSAKQAYEDAKMYGDFTLQNYSDSGARRKEAGDRYDKLIADWDAVKGNLDAEQQAEGNACFANALNYYNSATDALNESGPYQTSGNQHLQFAKGFLDLMSWDESEGSSNTAINKYALANCFITACDFDLGTCQGWLDDAECWVWFATNPPPTMDP